ncbi:DUF6942 family protein [Microbulbifer pacificus]|uniref:Uncharacterized protein n=1 Tax=Microbulbifer pacificus TaxID=407164 RepID=A0AAU0MZH0_9GAMM|nr:hypothetical protein [Microbulbifer pacificus]WOX05411.1 hypothetical protein R5R33_16955 [Microbulbifer pacificus]
MAINENSKGPSTSEIIGSTTPHLILYLPHRPNALEELFRRPSAKTLIENNSNHWRKIVTLLAKIGSPEINDWRRFRDEALFDQCAICFSASLADSKTEAWHWIGGKENLQRFNIDGLHTEPLQETSEVSIDIERRIFLTPYPDYRQLNNATVTKIRAALASEGFYG